MPRGWKGKQEPMNGEEEILFLGFISISNEITTADHLPITHSSFLVSRAFLPMYYVLSMGKIVF